MGTETTPDRAERVSVSLRASTVELLRQRQAELAKTTGMRVGFSQAAESALRRGLEAAPRN